MEVIIVDNNRTTPGVATEPAVKPLLADVRVRVVEAPTATNAAQARNAGLAHARGDWITFLDDDDVYRPDKVERQAALVRATNSPIVLCGYEVQLGVRRRRIQVGRETFSGDELLLDAVWGTPFLFVRADGPLAFREELSASEDLIFALDFVQRHGLQSVPCVSEPLVEVHLQPAEGRVNLRHEEHWRASCLLLREQGRNFSTVAQRVFLLRAMLQRGKGSGSWLRLAAVGTRLIRTGGPREIRRVVNAGAFRSGIFRRWVVS